MSYISIHYPYAVNNYLQWVSEQYNFKTYAF